MLRVDRLSFEEGSISRTSLLQLATVTYSLVCDVDDSAITLGSVWLGSRVGVRARELEARSLRRSEEYLLVW